jgi:hypothetical protein
LEAQKAQQGIQLHEAAIAQLVASVAFVFFVDPCKGYLGLQIVIKGGPITSCVGMIPFHVTSMHNFIAPGEENGEAREVHKQRIPEESEQRKPICLLLLADSLSRKRLTHLW